VSEAKTGEACRHGKIQKTQLPGTGICLYRMYARDISDTELALLRQCMPQRMKKTDAFRSEEGRALSAAAGYLMWTVLGLEEEAQIRFTEHGKPYAAGYPPFSVSHSRGLAVLAAADPGRKEQAGHDLPVTQLGADVEQIRDRHLAVERRAFVQEEREWLEKAADHQERLERFYRLWTLKESVIKADGRGLGMDMRSFEVLGLMEGRILEVAGDRYSACSLREEDYMISVCWK